MSVVLRRPTCGTTQGDAGECEACSEGEVRYCCTNHDGGVWLNGPVCGSCGAKFGDPPREATKRPTPRTSIASTPPAGAPDFRPPSRRGATESSSEPAVGGRPRRAEPEELAAPEVLPRTPSLGELLTEITEERARGRARYEVEDAPWARRPAEPRRPGLHLAGCLIRIVGLVFLLIVAAIIFLFLLFGAFLVD
jgi:hypothetical protein